MATVSDYGVKRGTEVKTYTRQSSIDKKTVANTDKNRYNKSKESKESKEMR